VAFIAFISTVVVVVVVVLNPQRFGLIGGMWSIILVG
jgi:hypothetical protein